MQPLSHAPSMQLFGMQSEEWSGGWLHVKRRSPDDCKPQCKSLAVHPAHLMALLDTPHQIMMQLDRSQTGFHQNRLLLPSCGLGVSAFGGNEELLQ